MNFKIISILVIILFSMTNSKAYVFDDCNEVSNLAGLMMELRQGGWAVSSLISMNEIASEPDKTNALDEITIEAYEVTRFTGETIKKMAIEEFRNKIYLRCYKQKKQ